MNRLLIRLAIFVALLIVLVPSEIKAFNVEKINKKN
jgi:hypothetical protein